MSNLYQKYAHHLDILRLEAGYTIKEFCFGVCNDRTFRRYLSGEATMSQEMLNKFCNKLGFSSSEFYRSFNISDTEELQSIYLLHMSIRDKDKGKARDLIRKLEKRNFINGTAERMFEYCLIYFNHSFKNVTDAHAYEQYSKLINYHTFKNRKYYDLVDIWALQQLMFLEIKSKQENALQILHSLLGSKDHIFITSESRIFLSTIYTDVAKVYGMLGYLNESLEVSTKGIDYSLSIDDLRELEHLYYFQALAFYKLRDESYMRSAEKCLLTAIIKEKYDYFTYIRKIMQTDFNIDPLEFIDIGEYGKKE